MERAVKQQKLEDGQDTVWFESDSLALRLCLLSSTPLADVICGVIEEFAVLRKRFAQGVDIPLTRSRYRVTNNVFEHVSDLNRPSEESEHFFELVTLEHTVVFEFDYTHHSRCGHLQRPEELTYCACSRVYRVRATLLPNLPFTNDPLFWFVLHEDESEPDSFCEEWEINRYFLVGSPKPDHIKPWYPGWICFRKPNFTDDGSILPEQDALGFATDKSTRKFLYWLVLAPRCHHEPESNHEQVWAHLLCPTRRSTWLDAELDQFDQLLEPQDESEPAKLRFTWIELDGPLSDQDPALENCTKPS